MTDTKYSTTSGSNKEV